MDKNVDVLVGLQWGDEGKGKIVDALNMRENYDYVVRFQGGSNSGHTVVVDDKKFVFHIMPSSSLNKETTVILGAGMVIDPVILMREVKQLVDAGIYEEHDFSKVLVSYKAHLTLPTHRLIDVAKEYVRNFSSKNAVIGSTCRGNTPTYVDKYDRSGLRAGDIYDPNFKNRVREKMGDHANIIAGILEGYVSAETAKDPNNILKLSPTYAIEENFADYLEEWFRGIEAIKFRVMETEHILEQELLMGKKAMLEGAQGAMLDIDHGSYPFVTSSHVTAPSAFMGSGVSLRRMRDVIGIFKAYTTRVGNGFYPTHIDEFSVDAGYGKLMADRGEEFGAATGRARKCGWLDLVALKHSVVLNGVTRLALTKSDVLNGFDKVKVAIGYKKDGEYIKYIPYDNVIDEVVYSEFDGWQYVEKNGKLSYEFTYFLRCLKDTLGVPINIISTGRNRSDLIYL